MAISRRVTARFHKRARTAPPTATSPSSVRPEQSGVRNLPVVETRSGLVATHEQISSPTHATTSSSICFSAHLRDARSRAEEILREHRRYDGRTGATCQPCLVEYPCDAVRAAEDVIAITEKLRPGRLHSSKALLEFMTDLVEICATDAAPENAEALPQSPR